MAKIIEYFFMLFMYYNVIIKNHAIVAFPNLLVKILIGAEKMNNITKRIKTSHNN